jgi:hypothetical protein
MSWRQAFACLWSAGSFTLEITRGSSSDQTDPVASLKKHAKVLAAAASMDVKRGGAHCHGRRDSGDALALSGASTRSCVPWHDGNATALEVSRASSWRI